MPAACFLMLSVSCKKDQKVEAPPAGVSFFMKDSLAIEPQYATLEPHTYNKYNGKTYVVNSEDQTKFVIQTMDDDVMFQFWDHSAGVLVPYFTITIKNTDFNSLAPEYDLADAAHVRMECAQRFIDASLSLHLPETVKSGVLKISYDRQFKTVSGEITNLRTPIDFYVPDDPPTDSQKRILIQNGGSTRTVSLKYKYVKIQGV